MEGINQTVMNKKSANTLYIISITLSGLMTILGLGALIYYNTVRGTYMSISSQTIYVIIAAAGPIGIMSGLKSIKGNTATVKKASLAAQAISITFCLLWIIFIYFISTEAPDMVSQAMIWLMAAATVKGLLKQIAENRK